MSVTPGERKIRNKGVTFRAVILSLLIIPFNAYWIYYTESVRYTGHPTCMSIFYNAIFIILILAAINALVRKVVPGRELAQGEMLTIYILVCMASIPASHDMLQILVPDMTYPFQFATPENRWDTLFADQLPKWLTVRDPVAVRGFYAGQASLYDPGIIKAWALPAAMWTLFMVILVFVLSCFTVLLRKQWTDNERLTYPLVHLPLQMTEERTPFYRSKLLWLGVAIALGMDLLQGLNMLYPWLPGMNMKSTDLQTSFVARPWSAIGWTPVRVYPFGIGLAALLPVDLSFSLWFFYIFLKLQLVTSASMGMDEIPRFPFLREQTFGAIIGLFVFSLWTGRRTFVSILRSSFSKHTQIDDSREPVGYRIALFGAAAGTVALFVFARAMGMSLWLIAAVFGIYYAISVTQTRMRAELGPPIIDFFLVGPDTMIPALIGSASIGQTNLIALTMMYWFNRTYRSHAMPLQLEAYKLADKSGISYRRLFIAMILAVAVGMVAAFWSELHIAYKEGAASGMFSPRGFGAEPYNRLDGWLRAPTGMDASACIAVAVGLAVTLVLNSLRMCLSWFPFHPVGYALCANWSMNLLWLSILIAWLAKLMLLRFGGLKLYRSAVPFFLGLILGEFIMGSLWTLFGIATGMQTYNIFP